MNQKKELQKHIAFSLCLTLTVLALSVTLFEPIFLTNDDVGMSMIAHGYGAYAKESPNLIFSNVVWGYFIQAIHGIGGITGYSAGALLGLLSAGTVFTFSFTRKQVNYYLAVLFTLVIILPAILFPQFTITAGLATVASIVCMMLYSNEKNLAFLIAGAALCFTGFLIRQEEAIIVILTAIPLVLPTRLSLLTDKPFLASIALLALMLATSFLINKHSYSDESWVQFTEKQQVRFKAIDTRGITELLKREDIYTAHGFTRNDLLLIKSWFIADENVFDTPRLAKALIEHKEKTPTSASNFTKTIAETFHTLTNNNIIHLSILSFLLMCIFPKKRYFLGWITFIFLMILVSLIFNRPGVVRIYTPILSLLVLVPLIENYSDDSFIIRSDIISLKKISLLNIMAMSSLLYVGHVFLNTAANLKKPIHSHLEALDHVDEDIIVAWGREFSYSLTYPLLITTELAKKLRIYSFGWGTWMPNTHHYYLHKNNDSFSTQIASKKGVKMWNPGSYKLTLLDTYCHEKHDKKLNIETVSNKNVILKNIIIVKCV